MRAHDLSYTLPTLEAFLLALLFTGLLVQEVPLLGGYELGGPALTLTLGGCLLPVMLYISQRIYQLTDLAYLRTLWAHLTLALGLAAGVISLALIAPATPEQLIQATAWQQVLGGFPRQAFHGLLDYTCWLFLMTLAGRQARPARAFLFPAPLLMLLALEAYGLTPLEALPRTLQQHLSHAMLVLACWPLLAVNPHSQGTAFAPSIPPTCRFLQRFFTLFFLLTNLLVVRCCSWQGYTVTAGVFVYPFTFLITDILTERYGLAAAQQGVWAGFIGQLTMSGVLGLFTQLLRSHPGGLEHTAFMATFSFTPAFFLGSIVAYWAGQRTDLLLFHALKKQTQGRHLWLRNNVATWTSQLVDTFVFSLVVWGLWPLAVWGSQASAPSWAFWWHLTLTEYSLKCFLALLDTPLLYGALLLLGHPKKHPTT